MYPSQTRAVVNALQARHVRLDSEAIRRRSHLPAVAARRAAADRNSVRSPRLADCAERRGRYWNVGSDVAVLRLRLRDCGVFCFCGWLGDRGNARGDTSFCDSYSRSMRDCGLVDPDIVDQSSGCNHFSDSFL